MAAEVLAAEVLVGECGDGALPDALAAARAGVTAARQIPNPSLDFGITYNGTTTVPSPWTVGPKISEMRISLMTPTARDRGR